MTDASRLLLMLGFSLYFAGCATSPPVDPVQTEMETVNAQFEGARVGTKTAWITEDLRAPASLSKVKNSLCASATNKKACDAKVRKDLHEKIHERYSYSDKKALEQKCRKNVTACHNLRNYEAWARASHNTRLDILRQKRLKDLAQLSLAHATPLAQQAVYDHQSDAYVIELHSVKSE